MFKQSGNTWQQDALIEGSDTRYGDAFGSVVSLSANADTLVVGASMETSSSSGVNGLEGHYDVEGAGAVYVFKYDGKTWQKRAFLKALTNNMKVNFGHSLSLSADGHTLAVGDRLEGVYVY